MITCCGVWTEGETWSDWVPAPAAARLAAALAGAQAAEGAEVAAVRTFPKGVVMNEWWPHVQAM